MKLLLTTNELIAHMKAKGILFNIVNESEAKLFLQNNNYYMKLASYRNNYPKYQSGEKAGQYMHLEFAYLKELSTIDMHLRYLIIQICLDIEHFLKVSLLSHIENNPLEDGYELIRKFLSVKNSNGRLQNEYILKKILGHNSSDYCKDLIEKYYPYFPTWVFVELISFGDLTYLCEFYNQLYKEQIVNNKFMNTVRDIRNASAHSNCLINKLFEPKTQQTDILISNFVQNIPTINKHSRIKNLNYRIVYNFVTLLYIYDSTIPNGIAKQKRYNELKKLFNTRISRHPEYFSKNQRITSIYKFVKKIIDNLASQTYNS